MSLSREESREKFRKASKTFDKALTTYVKEYVEWFNIELDEEEFEEMMGKIERMVSDAIDECADGGGYND
jgi:hypothetical protein